jgi:hypothetical protein
MNEVKHIYAFIADGEDGFCAMQIDNQHFPMVTAGRSEETLAAMKRAAPHVAKIAGRPIRLIKFTNAEEVEVFMPGAVQ